MAKEAELVLRTSVVQAEKVHPETEVYSKFHECRYLRGNVLCFRGNVCNSILVFWNSINFLKYYHYFKYRSLLLEYRLGYKSEAF